MRAAPSQPHRPSDPGHGTATIGPTAPGSSSPPRGDTPIHRPTTTGGAARRADPGGSVVARPAIEVWSRRPGWVRASSGSPLPASPTPRHGPPSARLTRLPALGLFSRSSPTPARPHSDSATVCCPVVRGANFACSVGPPVSRDPRSFAIPGGTKRLGVSIL